MIRPEAVVDMQMKTGPLQGEMPPATRWESGPARFAVLPARQIVVQQLAFGIADQDYVEMTIAGSMLWGEVQIRPNVLHQHRLEQHVLAGELHSIERRAQRDWRAILQPVAQHLQCISDLAFRFFQAGERVAGIRLGHCPREQPDAHALDEAAATPWSAGQAHVELAYF